MTPKRDNCATLALMIAASLAFVTIAAADSAWQRVKRLWKRGGE